MSNVTTLTRRDFVKKALNHPLFVDQKHYQLDKVAVRMLSVLTEILSSGVSISVMPEGHIVVCSRRFGSVVSPHDGKKHILKKGLSVRFRKRPQKVDYITPSQLIVQVADSIDEISEAQAKVLVDTFIFLLRDVSKGTSRLTLRGFGTFNPRERKIKGKASSVVVKFKASKKLLDAIN